MRYVSLVFLLLVSCLIKKEINNPPAPECKKKNALGSISLENNLIGGKPADMSKFPATFYTSQGNARCTGTIVGPKALLLAAHCVGNGKQSILVSNGVTYTGVCTHHPKYKSDPTSDFALCLLDKEIPLAFYDSLSKSEVVVGDMLLLSGFGCVTQSGTGGNDGVLRIGEAKVVETPKDDNDIVTEGNAALCFGDSGGAAYLKDPKSGLYFITAINSRGDIKTSSYLPAVYLKDPQEFFQDWSKKNNAYICGLNDIGEKCRGYVKPEPPKPEPTPPGPVPPGPSPIPGPSPSPDGCL